MPNFHPILFKFCAYVNYMLIYNIHRERKFLMTITNLAAVFLELFEPPRTGVFMVKFTFYHDQHDHSQRSFIKDLISGERNQDLWSSGVFNPHIDLIETGPQFKLVSSEKLEKPGTEPQTLVYISTTKLLWQARWRCRGPNSKSRSPEFDPSKQHRVLSYEAH